MKNNGGAAFPSAVGDIGMSLRDWFAGQAMNGIIASSDSIVETIYEAAIMAYRCADAMLAERKKE